MFLAEYQYSVVLYMKLSGQTQTFLRKMFATQKTQDKQKAN